MRRRRYEWRRRSQQYFAIKSVSIKKTSNIQLGRQGSRLSMKNLDSTLRLPTFHGIGRDYVEQHCFMCETIYSVNRVINEESKIV
jgi:hypothetical protein